MVKAVILLVVIALHLMWLMDPGMLQLTMLDQSSDPVGSDGATLDVANGPRYVTTDYA